uniref:Putative secreted protein n=1 Tax=Anopheles marajoara TaxID=58244 RepID=A0A2M4CDS7_9DIPT
MLLLLLLPQLHELLSRRWMSRGCRVKLIVDCGFCWRRKRRRRRRRRGQKGVLAKTLKPQTTTEPFTGCCCC